MVQFSDYLEDNSVPEHCWKPAPEFCSWNTQQSHTWSFLCGSLWSRTGNKASTQTTTNVKWQDDVLHRCLSWVGGTIPCHLGYWALWINFASLTWPSSAFEASCADDHPGRAPHQTLSCPLRHTSCLTSQPKITCKCICVYKSKYYILLLANIYYDLYIIN